MTGFGKAEFSEDGIRITAEVQSVNSRFLDLKMKLPRFMNEFESDVREIVQKSIGRGRVFLGVTVDMPELRASCTDVDFGLASKYLEIAREMSSRFGINGDIDVHSLISLPDVLKHSDDDIDATDRLDRIYSTIQSALEAHGKMREKEGSAIGADIEARLALLGEMIESVEKSAPEIIEANTARLRKKIEALLEPGKFDEGRFAMEVSLYADRVDVTEECVRFRSHCVLFAKEIKAPKTSGKKLSFLLQEMNREANTITSKALDASISHVVVRIKEELERMREQVENME